MVIVVIRLLPRTNLRPPCCEVTLRCLAHKQIQDRPHIPRKSKTVLNVLVNLGGINVNVNKLAIRRVFAEITRLAVGKTAAERDHEISSPDRIIRCLFPMHSCKAEHLRMRARQRPHTHECMHHGQMILFDECHDLGGRTR